MLCQRGLFSSRVLLSLLTDKVGLVLILHQPSIPTIQELHQPPPRSHFAQQPAAGGFEPRNLALRLISLRRPRVLHLSTTLASFILRTFLVSYSGVLENLG